MMRSNLRTTLLFSLLLLGGCVAAWGSSYNIESQSADAISIQYDTNFIDASEIPKIANKLCSTYHRVAVSQTQETNMMNISTETFSCQDPAPSAL